MSKPNDHKTGGIRMIKVAPYIFTAPFIIYFLVFFVYPIILLSEYLKSLTQYEYLCYNVFGKNIY